MSTPAVIKFSDDGAVYVHWDGYPENILPDWERFKEAVKRETTDHRFGDPAYLAAKYVVYKAREFGNGLNFLSLGVVNPDGNYGQEHTYVVVNGEIKEI